MKKKTEKDEIEQIEERILYLLKILLGLIIIALGIAGLFLPIIPGIALIIIGLILVGNRKIKSLMLRLLRKLMKKLG